MASAEFERTDWQDTNVQLYDRREEGIGKWLTELIRELNDNKSEVMELKAWKVTKDKIVPSQKLAVKGTCYSDEVYIVLNRNDPQTAVIPERRVETPIDIYCWVGKSATPDLYRKGLHSTIALDEALGGKPVVHREVQDFESKRFINMFKFFTVLKGSDELDALNQKFKYKNRLLRVTGPMGLTLCMRETALKRGAMRSPNDVFIVDAIIPPDNSPTIHVWIGSRSYNCHSRVTKAQEHAERLKVERGKSVRLRTVYEDEMCKTDAMYQVFPPQAKKPIEAKQWKSSIRTHYEADLTGVQKRLIRKMFEVIPLNPAHTEFRYKKLFEGEDVSLGKMEDPSKVYVVHVCNHVYVRIDDGTWAGEKGNGLIIGHDYLKTLQKEGMDPGIPITVVKTGQFSIQIRKAIGE